MNTPWFCQVIIILCWSSFSLAGEPAIITIGQEVQKQIVKGETHRYQITLNDQPTRIIIKPNYFDVALSVRPLGSKNTKRVNSPAIEIGDEYFVLTPSISNEYVIEIEGISRSFNSGDYTLAVTQPLFSQNQLVAAILTTKAAQVRIDDASVSRKEALAKSLELYHLSALAWQEAGDAAMQGRSLIYKGWLALELGDLQTAESSFTGALALNYNNYSQYVWVYAYLAFVKLEQDELDSAEAYFHQALDLSQEEQDQRNKASFLNYVGLINQIRNLPVAAADWYSKSLALLETIDYSQQEAQVLSNVGGTYYQMGRFNEALEHYQRALKIHEQFKDRNEQATVLGNIASLYRDQGDLSESLQYNLKTLEIYKELADTKNQNLVYHRLGILFQRMGDYQRSEVYFLRAFEGRKQAKSLRRAANTLRSMSVMYSENGRLNKAIRTQKDALSLYTLIDSKVDIAKTQVALAESLIKQNELKKAKALLDKALPPLQDARLLPHIADALMQLGNINAILNNTNSANELFAKALEIQRSVFDPIGEINALMSIAYLESDLLKSLALLDSAEIIANRIYHGVANPALKARFSATLQKLYDKIIETHINLHKLEPQAGHDKLAFMASERNRARSLLELIHNSKVGATTERSEELQKEKQLRRRLNGLWYSVNEYALRSKNQETQELTATNKNAIADLTTQLDNLTIQLSQKKRFDNKNDEFSLSDIQESLFHDELLLHIHLGKNQSAIWDISKTHLSVTTLPAQNIIESMARDAYDALKQTGFSKSDKAKLSTLRKLLIQDPTILVEKRNIYVVADGFIQYIPFGALIDESNRFLVESTTFLNLPSSRTLLQRSDAPVFSEKTSLLVYADPIFGDNDFRARQSNKTVNFTSEFSQETKPESLNSVSRLAFSSIEAKQLSASIPSAQIISGYSANKNDILHRDIRNIDILHFATHGIVNDDYPALSGLIFSLIDNDKMPIDGFLSAADISILPMSPKLVVLSACETGVGEAVPGEGLLSLARVFLGQGSENVVSSLWRVDDQATAELMRHFYYALVERQDSIAFALRYAQTKLASQAKWEAPYYWAGFIISSANPYNSKGK